MLICPKCNNNTFVLKREASYIYEYKIDSNTPDIQSGKTTAVPYLFYHRDQTHTEEYLECETCKTHYPCSLGHNEKDIDLVILQKAIRSDHTVNPEFLG
jgi:uncharacterized protein YbaR (Trm112 family)